MGIITLLPPIIVIVFALKTRKTIEALIIGGVLACIIGNGFGFVGAYMDFLYETLSDTGNIWCILIVGLFGSLTAIMQKARATGGFTKFMLKYATTEKKSLMMTWVLGIIIFVDDYLNVLTLGNTMREITDQHKTPREMLAYVVDSTAAPVCMLLPISSQAVYWSSVIAQEEEMQSFGTGIQIFVKTIPLSFYSWAAVLIVPLVILGIIPKIGPMKKAYTRTLASGITYGNNCKKLNKEDMITEEEMEFKESKASPWDFIIPIGIMVAVTIYCDLDVLYGVMAALVASGIIYMGKRMITFKDFSDSFVSGFGDMFLMIAIIVTALTMQKCLTSIGMSEFIVNSVASHLNPAFLPAVAFVVVAALSFTTGSCWGVPAVTIPVFIPLVFATGANPILTFAAILSSATFGSHACFYSDATVLTSSATKIENLDHALTQLPYALIAAGLATLTYLVIGFATM